MENSLVKGLSISAALCLLIISAPTFADNSNASTSTVPNSGFFVGIGGGYNSINVDQDLNASGISDVFTGGTQVAYGQAGGPASPFHDTQSSLAPEIQLGYFKHFANSHWLWGAKFFYTYPNTTSTNKPVDVPQSGSFTSNTQDTFTGNVVIQSAQVSLDNEIALMPLIGRSFTNSVIYFGIGPALFDTESKINGARGYADINGIHSNITGSYSNFSSTDWLVGGAAEIGGAYYIKPTWFIDCNYTFAMTGWNSDHYSAPFSSQTTVARTTYTDTGTLYVNTSQRLISQSIMITINKVF